MKLSALISYLNLLQEPEFDPTYEAITDKLGAISRAINDHSLQFGSLSDDLNADLNNIKSAILSFDTTLQLLKQKLQSEIQQQEPEYYKESMRLFEQDMVFETTDYILNRRLKVDFDTSE